MNKKTYTVHQLRVRAVRNILNKKDLPTDMRQHWGRVAKQLGPYYPVGDTFKSWLTAKKKKKR
tara:strand:+ start:1001 stop:1189 length:189 start_codon:yes stop_codon:yes gene_type:complete